MYAPCSACTGEERFSIAYEGKGGDVYFDMLSFSKGAPPLGRILMPFIRPLQVGSTGHFLAE